MMGRAGGILLALVVALGLATQAHAAKGPDLDLRAPVGGEVFAPGTTQIVAIAPSNKVQNFEVVLTPDNGVDAPLTLQFLPDNISTVSNVSKNRKSVHYLMFTVPAVVTSNAQITVNGNTKKGPVTVTSGRFVIGSPGLLPNSVDSSHIIDGSILGVDFQNNSIGNSKLAVNDIFIDKIAAWTDTLKNTPLAANQVMTTNGAGSAIWVPINTLSALPTGAAGGDLTGTYPNPTLTGGAVETAALQDSAVTALKLSNSPSDLNDALRAVTTDHIRLNAVTTTKIGDQQVTLPKLERGQVGQLIVAQGAGNSVSYQFMSGDGMIDQNAALTIQPDRIDDSKLRDSASDVNDILRAVTSDHIRLNAITRGKILDGAVSGSKIATDGVNGITTSNINDSQVTTQKIADNTILSSDLESTFNDSLHRDTELKLASLVSNVLNSGDPSFTTLTASTSATRSGAFILGVFDEFNNSNSTQLQGVLKDFDVGISNAAQQQNLFLNVVTPNDTLIADSATDTLTFSTGGVITITGNAASDSVNFSIADLAITGDKIENVFAGAGLVFTGSMPKVLNVGAGTGITVNPDSVQITDDGVDGAQLANNITVDEVTQTITFPANSGAQMIFNFPNISANSQIFSVNKGAGGATPLFTLDSDGDALFTGMLNVNGISMFNSQVQAKAGLAVTGANLEVGNPVQFFVNVTNGNINTNGSISAAGAITASSINANGLSSNTDVTVDLDDDNTPAQNSSFIVRDGTNVTVFQVSELGAVSGFATLNAGTSISAPTVTATNLLFGNTGATLGTATGAAPGQLIFHDGAPGTNFFALMQTPAGLSANRTLTLPDTDGTLATLNDITSANLSGVISAAKGGTGADNSAPANGQILVGNAGAGTYVKTTLASGNSTINIAGGAGTLDIQLPQSVATTANPMFNSASLTTTLGVGTDATIGGRLAASPPGSVQVIGASGTIPNGNTFVRVGGSAAVTNVTISTTGAVSGQILVIEGTNDTNTVTVTDGSGTNNDINGDITLGNRDTLTLIFNGTLWIEISRSDN